MLRTIFMAGGLALLTSVAVAQSSKSGSGDLSFDKGTKVLDAGVGLGSPYWSTGFSNSLPFNPRIGMEAGITENISVGGSVAYSGSSFKYFGGKINYNAFFISARGAYHFATSEKLDPYAGLSLGYVLVSVGNSQSGFTTAASSGVGYGLFAGLRYYLKPKFGLNAELGYSSFSFLNVGVSFKLK